MSDPDPVVRVAPPPPRIRPQSPSDDVTDISDDDDISSTEDFMDESMVTWSPFMFQQPFIGNLVPC